MEQHPPGSGGSANTPPFPRLTDDSPGTPRPSSAEGKDPERLSTTRSDATEDRDAAPGGPESGSRSESPQPGPVGEDAVADTTTNAEPDARYLDDNLDFDDEPGEERAEELSDLYYDEEEQLNDDLDRDTLAEETRAGRSFASRASARLLLRAETTLQRGAVRMADRLEGAAERIERLADDRLQGSERRAKAGEAAQSAARWIDDLATYLRDRDADALREDIENQVRDRPMQTILLAAAAGWIVGRIMR